MHAEPELVSQTTRQPAWSLTGRSIKKRSPFWLVFIGKLAAARMIHLTKTGSAQKPSFATL
jgi:hypothetical protein